MTQEEYNVLSTEDIFRGTYESSPIVKNNLASVAAMARKGLVSMKQDSDWNGSDERFVMITSMGILELNIFRKKHNLPS